MTLGPGKYDDAASLARSQTGGSVLLVVIDGDKGHGFSCQTSATVLARMPTVLRSLATQLEDDARRLAKGARH